MEQIVTAAMAAMLAFFGFNADFTEENVVSDEEEYVTTDYGYYEDYYREAYYEDYDYCEYIPPYDADDGIDPSEFQYLGVVEDGDTTYTWYSENVLPGGGLDDLNENGRHVDESGFVVDGDGYIAVASSDHEMGEIVETPWGEGKVYDTGCAEGAVDVYTAW